MVPAWSTVPTRASSWSARRPGVSAPDPAQQACAHAFPGTRRTRARTNAETRGAWLRDLVEVEDDTVGHRARELEAELPLAGHVKVHVGEDVVPFAFRCQAGRDVG